ncbi:hypothetical protein RhiirA5_483216 [Rhizophagus irregularis]|uniref:Uncharacterized protein n=1 Tax=Rhizophagus irregularis TaxID=588596 RepID=A0A2N0PHJ7_9GLOM|nr:hypothetical protein RhiirA5_483216 [Rhizophagus irregularis]
MWKESRLKFMPKEDMPPPEGMKDDFIYSNPYYLRPPSPPSPPPSPPSSSLSRFLVQSATKEVKEVEKIEKVEKVNNNDIPQLIQLHIKRLEKKSFKFTFNEDKAKFIK